MAFQVMIICPDHSLKTDMAQLVKEEREKKNSIIL